MEKYGITWWGEKWLDAFKGIDNSNRLPRGKTYANTGRAYDITIQNHSITGLVSGSSYRPYKVTITLDSFTEKDQKLIQEVINSTPSIIYQLINKKLPIQLFEKLKSHDIQLFPKNWRDLHARCSCPDSAVPCKHIAAIIYLVAQEIDKNPFLVFKLHDCDLMSLMNHYQDESIEDAQKITFIEDIFKPYTPLPDEPVRSSSSEAQIDFSQVPDLQNLIINTLSNEAVFYHKNFRDLLKLAYTHWKKKPLLKLHSYLNNGDNFNGLKSESSPEEVFSKNWGNPSSWQDFKLTLNDTHHLTEILRTKNPLFNKTSDLSLTLVKFLYYIPSSYLNQLSPEIVFIHSVYQFALKLIEKSAFIPQILQNKKSRFFIRWIPALFDESIHKTFQNLLATSPGNLIQYQKNTLHPEEELKSILSVLISGCISSNVPTALSGVNDNSQSVFKLFFTEYSNNFKDFSELEIPSIIQNWLSRLYLSDKPYRIHLMIENHQEDEFEIAIHVSLEDSHDTLPIYDIIHNKKVPHKLSIFSDLTLLSEYLPGLEDSLDNKESLHFNLDDFKELFLKILPILKALGILIVLPKSLRKVFKPKLSLNLSSEGKIKDDRESFLNLSSLLKFDWEIAIGDKKLSISEFKKLLKTSRNLVKIVDEYVFLDEKEMENLLKQINKLPSELSQHDLMQAALSGELDGANVEIDKHLESLFKNLSKIKPVKVPKNLKADLRPYQERGFSWLVQNIETRFGSILADDMGLGKTLQVIGTILHYKNLGNLKKERVLIVAPTSLLSNWHREIERFAPELTTFIYHGQNRNLIQDHDVIITSYGLARRDLKDINKIKWFLLIIDEAQNIKNPSTEQTKSIKSLNAKHKIAMTGTPVENRLLEYWSIFDFTQKNYLGSAKDFQKQFATPIEKDRNQACLSRFMKITSPFILRRLKSDKTIIKDLPDKIQNNLYCSLTSEQTALYQEVLNLTLKKISESEGIERKGLIFQLINALKQICNHPSQYSKKQKSHIGDSGKMESLDSILTNIHELGEKTLIFTQYTAMGDIISKLIEERFNQPVPFLYGALSRKKRDEIVHDFQNLSQTKILIVSLKAGGTGLNLTAANHVIHYDLWWNPAVEAQATDRAYRIGQKSNVMVHRLITSGTFEERIDAMIQSKKELADLAVSSGESWITEMNDQELKDIFSLRKNLTS